jgi:replicative DNA helicase
MENNLRTPPHSIDAEKGVLSSILLDPCHAVDKCRESGLTPDSFYDRRHQAFYGELIEMPEELDALLIAQILSDKGMIDKVGGYEYLADLQVHAGITGHIEHYANIVLDKARSRDAISLFSDAIACVHKGDNTEMVIAGTIVKSEEILPEEKESLSGTVDTAIEEMKLIASGKLVFLQFPWIGFQVQTFGLPIGSVTPLLGRDKTGKSRLVMTFVLNWLMTGVPTLVYAFEDGKRRYIQNMAASLGEYDGFGMRRRPTDTYIETAEKCMRKIGEMPLTVVEEARTVEQIVNEIGAFRRKHNIPHETGFAVVIDGWKDIVESGGKENRTQSENHMFEHLKKGALRHNVGILSIEHPHDVEDKMWLSKRNIKGSKQRFQSARMALVYQDSGLPECLRAEFGLGDGEGYVVLDCQAASYGEKARVILQPELTKGRFNEIRRVDDN